MALDDFDFPDGSLPGDLSGADGWDTPSEGEDPAHPFLGDESGRYQRRQLLGQGGMGRVVVAFDRRLRREVALKELLVRPGGPSSGSARLAREAWITAQLDHPGIVPVLDAGSSADGRLFYTMPVIDGRTLSDALASAGDLSARLELLPRVLAAAQAVGHAHQAGIVHRDLKPANILVGKLGETRVADWGLARSTREAESSWREWLATFSTDALDGEPVRGTPRYMSPEQANGLKVGPSTDVWSLGVVLYEVVAGQRPFEGDALPSVLAEVRRARPAPLPPDTPPELDAIIGRCIQHDPALRYPDAVALATDLDNHLAGRRVSAYRYRPVDSLFRLVSAWRAPLGVALVAALVLGVVSVSAWSSTVSERNRAQQAERSLQLALDASDQVIARSLTHQAMQALASENRAEAELLAANALTYGEDARARGVLAAVGGRPRPGRSHHISLPEGCLRPHLPTGDQPLLCVFSDRVDALETSSGQLVWRRTIAARQLVADRGAPIAHIKLPGDVVVSLDLTTGGLGPAVRTRQGSRSFLAGPTPGQAILHNVNGLELVHKADDDPGIMSWCGDEVHEVATTHGADILVLCLDGRLVEGPIGRQPNASVRLETGAAPGGPVGMAVSPDGQRVAVASRDGVLLVADRTDGRTRSRSNLGVGALLQALWSPDGSRLLVTSTAGPAVIISAESGAVVDQIPTEGARAARWDGDHGVVLVDDTHLSRWELPPDGRPGHWPQGSGISSVAVSPDGALAAVGRGDGMVVVIDLQTGRTVARGGRALPEHVCKDVAFLADGSAVLGTYAMRRGVLRLDVADGASAMLEPERTAYFRRLLSLEGPRLVGLAYGQAGAVAFDEDGVSVPVLELPGEELWEGDDAHGHRFGVALSSEGRVYRFRTEPTPTIERMWDVDGPVAVDITSDGATVAVALDGARGVRVFDADTGKVTRSLNTGPTRVTEVAWSADGTWLAVGDLGGRIQLYRGADTTPQAVLHSHTQLVSALEFTPDGQSLLSGGWDGVLRVSHLPAVDARPEVVLADAASAWGLSVEEVLKR